MAHLLGSQRSDPTSPIDSQLIGLGAANGASKLEPLFLEAKDDVKRALDILEHVASSAPEMQKTRTEYLRAAYEEIGW